MGDAPEQAAAEQEQESKSGGSRLIIIIVGFVVLLGGIGAVAMMVLGKGDENADLAAPVVKMDEPGYMYSFPSPFTGNLAYPDNEFIYSAKVTLEIITRGDYGEPEALNEMGLGDTENTHSKLPYIRKIIMEEIRTKTRLEITGTDGQERTENTIKNNLNTILEKGQIKNVFLEVFVN